MSTNKQQYSLVNQANALFAYAEKHNIAVARTFDDETLIRMLKSLYEKKGTMSRFAIERSYEMPRYTTYRDRFGTLLKAYQLAGIPTARDCSYIAKNRKKRADTDDTLDVLIDELRLGGHLVVKLRYEEITWSYLDGNLQYANHRRARCGKQKDSKHSFPLFMSPR